MINQLNTIRIQKEVNTLLLLEDRLEDIVTILFSIKPTRSANKFSVLASDNCNSNFEARFFNLSLALLATDSLYSRLAISCSFKDKIVSKPHFST